jgi:hypothetical protein
MKVSEVGGLEALPVPISLHLSTTWHASLASEICIIPNSLSAA